MTPGRMRPGLLIAVLGGAVAVYCLTATPWLGGDPTLAIELLGVVLLAGWILLGARALARGYSLARQLDEWSDTATVAGVECRIIRDGGRHAFVLGAVRPRIYLGDALLDTLDPDELRAVLLHEDHHRRTLAPLRSVALEGWLMMLGRWRPARMALLDRLTDLENAADAYAIRRGISPAALARALVKSEAGPTYSGAAFGGASDRRLRTLLARADGIARTDSPRLPYEWLPVAFIVVVAIACHLDGVSPQA